MPFHLATQSSLGICYNLDTTAVSESRLCFLKRVSELASVNVDGGAGSALVPTERIELTSSASEADVLPLDEAELSPPDMGGRVN